MASVSSCDKGSKQTKAFESTELRRELSFGVNSIADSYTLRRRLPGANLPLCANYGNELPKKQHELLSCTLEFLRNMPFCMDAFTLRSSRGSAV